jgi:diaminopimelate epimerase
VYDHGIAKKSPLRIETGNGVLEIGLEVADGRARRATVDMGPPILEAAKIPVSIPGVGPADRVVGYRGSVYEMTCVSMGNPHVVVFCDDVAAIPLEQIGPELEHDKMFPRRINVHFVQVHNRGEVTMRTWERGSGITLACGTGASAVCVAGVLTGRTDRKVLAHLPGGDLELNWKEADGRVYMTGEAVEVFQGEIAV